jgi:hypothetical protein
MRWVRKQKSPLLDIATKQRNFEETGLLKETQHAPIPVVHTSSSDVPTHCTTIDLDRMGFVPSIARKNPTSIS